MANHLQTKKRIRQTKRKYARNKPLRSQVRKSITTCRLAVEAGKSDTAQKELKNATRKLDKMVTKRIMKRKTASRTISRLTRAVNRLSAE